MSICSFPSCWMAPFLVLWLKRGCLSGFSVCWCVPGCQSPASRRGHTKQSKIYSAVILQFLRILASLPSLHLLESYVCFVSNVQGFQLYLVGGKNAPFSQKQKSGVESVLKLSDA